MTHHLPLTIYYFYFYFYFYDDDDDDDHYHSDDGTEPPAHGALSSDVHAACHASIASPTAAGAVNIQPPIASNRINVSIQPPIATDCLRH